MIQLNMDPADVWDDMFQLYYLVLLFYYEMYEYICNEFTQWGMIPLSSL